MAEKAKLNTKIFFRLVSYAKAYKGILALAFSASLLIALFSALRPKLIGDMVRNFIVDKQDSSGLLLWTGIIMGMLVFEALFQFAGSYFSNLLAQNIIKDLRKKLFAHIMTFKMKYFDRTPIGALVTRVVSDLEAVSEVFSSGLIDILGDIIMLLTVLAWMFYTNSELTLLTLIPIPLLLFATRIFARAMRKSFQLERLQVTKLNTFVQERISGMAIVQMFGREKQEYASFEEINKGHRQAHVNAVWAFSIFFPVVEMLSSLSIALLLVWGAFQVDGVKPENQTLMYSQIISFTLWINMLYRPIRQLADKFNILQRGTVRAERVFEILDLNEHIQHAGAETNVDFNQNIEFKHVFFAYQNEEYVLKDINLEIVAGSTVAFVGATGAGKSSIVNLIGRFYEFQKGSILLGGQDIKEIDLSHLRRNIAIVLQDVFLFSDSIHNNITLGDESISREQVTEAAKAVKAHEFIVKLPDGYDYHVGERGGVLSVGQRQLISFIRAYVFQPKILILDEATSSVDDHSEELIQNATVELTKGRTSIVIAHRLSTIQSADKIVVLEKGEIMEVGTHVELLSLENGYYRKLFDMQFSEENTR
jgi:ATP-binding cassette subfamily B multidrug efflux pump|tara:strand:- start:20210 stop:21985 length:1776 start_codon:yes stop_codon:yes gene_type:complete